MEGHGRHTLEDFSNGFPARAMGSEVEYTHPDSIKRPFLGTDARLKLVNYINPDHLVSFGRNRKSSAVVSNGGELYLDGTFEFATPECASPQEVALHERAGEQVMTDFVDTFCAQEGSGIAKVFKRGGYPKVTPKNTEKFFSDSSSIGYHESYTSMHFSQYDYNERPRLMRKAVGARALSDFLALRKLIDGAGMIGADHFSLSQKVPAINFRYYHPDHRCDGKIPFGQKSSRLEIRSGEHSKSDWATEFTFGLTSLIVRLIEHDKYPTQYLLHDANEAVKSIIRDPHALVQLESGIVIQGKKVLWAIVEAADELGRQYPDEYPEYERKAVDDFLNFYNDLEDVNLQDGDTKSLLRINWAGRYDYFMRLGIKPGKFDASDPQQLAYDLVYDRIGDKDIARRIYSKLGISALRIDMPEPPETRAKARVALARPAYLAGTLSDVEWHQVRINGEKRYILGGPLNQVATQPIK